MRHLVPLLLALGLALPAHSVEQQRIRRPAREAIQAQGRGQLVIDAAVVTDTTPVQSNDPALNSHGASQVWLVVVVADEVGAPVLEVDLVSKRIGPLLQDFRLCDLVDIGAEGTFLFIFGIPEEAKKSDIHSTCNIVPPGDFQILLTNTGPGGSSAVVTVISIIVP